MEGRYSRASAGWQELIASTVALRPIDAFPVATHVSERVIGFSLSEMHEDRSLTDDCWNTVRQDYGYLWLAISINRFIFDLLDNSGVVYISGPSVFGT